MSAHAGDCASESETRNDARPFSVRHSVTLRIPCACVGGCVLCVDGLRPMDRVDLVRLRRYALNRGYTSTVRMADRALADDDDAIAWHHCAEALR